MSERIAVGYEVGGRYRLNMMNAETGEQIGTMNTRPHDTWAMLDEERQRRVVMYCELANAMHPHTEFRPTTPTRGASDAAS